jgi:D-alanine-D-alanine ligase-like ATP-grasp enzyme
MFPSCSEQLTRLSEKYSEHIFTIVMQKPGMFLFDDNEDQILCSKVKYVFIEEENNYSYNYKNIAEVIIDQKPDIAIAVTYWTQPFDWMCIKDSLVAELLMQKGIKTICHNSNTAMLSFDKNLTHDFLIKNNFNCAPGIFISHDLFYAERRSNVIKENIYKDYILSKIEKLKYPVVIKDTLGLSSFGMDVVKTFEEAKHILFSKKTNADRLVETYISGLSFGLEIYGTKETGWTVTPPLINSVNQFGLTSPKQNVKLGPVLSEEMQKKFHINELNKEMYRLAELLNLNGIAQIDLIFSEDKWYIIEINSRISGMSQTMAASLNLSIYELILFSAGLIKITPDYKYVMNLKFPLLPEEKLKQMSELDFVYEVNQIENKEAKQLREVGYTETIFGQTKDLSETMKMLDKLNELFPDEMEKRFYDNAYKLFSAIYAKILST